ncbi:hypothetical protein J437_LFUL004631 [Ladona fulva]|uniref:Uncharacterized protein n=1 Tax=Ladona fulva TaxID=123851 RepID=A0A8K0JY94_LADFU|nr:hypothetical protein J437_LFUL004631 [Ladona fulva]
MEPDINPENLLNILVATDIHLGYAEKDPIRGEDSFIAFEEILTLAVENKVDFLLLGGDLFHDNKPSPKCLHKCITLLRRYCMGDSPITFEFLSDQSINFGNCPFPHVNYEDPNLNISLPVFSIHGNHDDPTVNWNLAALDLLSAAGLVNYFGCCTNLQKVEVRPLLLRKGSSCLALFGLGSMKDERLSRLLSQSKVDIFRPKVHAEDWFNLMVLHQNHVIRGTSAFSYVPEAALPDFLDLIVWGHEHECIPDPVWNPTKEFFVLQPGSSVATSLSEGEAVSKHVFLLRIHGKKFKTEKIKLQTVRPFVYEALALSKFDSLQPENEDQKTMFGKFKKEKISLSKKATPNSPGCP